MRPHERNGVAAEVRRLLEATEHLLNDALPFEEREWAAAFRAAEVLAVSCKRLLDLLRVSSEEDT